MRVLPINNFKTPNNLTKTRVLEKPTVETVQNTDSVSFKGNYRQVFQESLRKNIKDCHACRVVYENLIKAVSSERLSTRSIYFLNKPFTYLTEISSNANEVVATCARTNKNLLTIEGGAMNFFNPDGGTLPIKFFYDGDAYCIERPGNTFNFHDLTSELLVFREERLLDYLTGRIKSFDEAYVTIKERMVVDGEGRVSSHTYYDTDGHKDFWKTLLFGG